MSKLDPIPPFDRRRARAMAIVGSIMKTIDPLLGEDVRRGRIADALLGLFHEADAEIITEHDRREAGLPPRNEYGLTPFEHQAIEAKRYELMVQPLMPMVISVGGERERALEAALRSFLHLFAHNEDGKPEDIIANLHPSHAYEVIDQCAHRDVPISSKHPVITVGQIQRARAALASPVPSLPQSSKECAVPT